MDHTPKRPKKKKYSHAYEIAFEVESNDSGLFVTSKEMIAGLRKRLIDLENNKDEIVEACGAPFDTHENY